MELFIFTFILLSPFILLYFLERKLERYIDDKRMQRNIEKAIKKSKEEK